MHIRSGELCFSNFSFIADIVFSTPPESVDPWPVLRVNRLTSIGGGTFYALAYACVFLF